MRPRLAATALAWVLAVGACPAAPTPLPWLYGTQSFETFPYHENNLEYGLRGLGTGSARQEVLFEGGILDSLEFDVGGGYTAGPDPGTAWLAQGGLRWRLGEAGEFPLDFGLLARVAVGAATSGGEAGVVLAKSLGDHHIALNILAGSQPSIAGYAGREWSVAWKSPYLAEGLRLGLEAGQAFWAGRVWGLGWAPQIDWELPGDLSFQVGSLFLPGHWSAGVSVSYDIFPSP